MRALLFHPDFPEFFRSFRAPKDVLPDLEASQTASKTPVRFDSDAFSGIRTPDAASLDLTRCHQNNPMAEATDLTRAAA